MNQGILQQGSRSRNVVLPSSKKFNRARSVPASHNFSSSSNFASKSVINSGLIPSIAEHQTYEKLPLSLFKDANAARYICSSCQNVPLSCSSCDRGHIFCKKCLIRLVDSQQRCPVDNESIKKHNILHGNLILDNIITNLIVYCVYSNPNEFQIAEDSIEGGRGGQRAGNTSGELPNSAIAQPEFKENYNFNDANNVSCPWEGNVSLFAAHVKQCAFKPLDCPFSSIGCSIHISQGMNDHIDNNIIEHQHMLLRELMKLRNEVKYLRMQQQNNDGMRLKIKEELPIPKQLYNIELNIVIGVGCNEKGEMGNDSDENVVNLGKLEWSKNKNIISMYSCAYKAFAYLNIDQNIYVCGCNDYGALGIGNVEDQWIPVLHNYFLKQNIKITTVSKSISSFHMFFIAENGAIYASGSNEQGQLGLNDEKQRNSVTKVLTLKNKHIVDIGCGTEHSLFLNNNGKVYACGSNESFQLGVQTPSLFIVKPVLVILEKGVSISQICCGRTHSYLLDNSGNVWSFGSNSHGQLGVPKAQTNRQKAPIKINFFSANNCRVMKCASGNDHGCAMDSNGYIYVWGRGDEGQIGDGKKNDRYFPTKLEFFTNKRISDIFCGCHHTVVLTLEHRVFCWGNNRYNQCNDEYQAKFDTDHIPVSKPIELYNSAQIVEILAGSYHTLLIINSDLETRKNQN